MPLAQWLGERIRWAAVAGALRARTVPAHDPGLYVGGVTLFLCALQVASGSLLLLHYHASPAYAYDSVLRISTQLPYGDLVRGVHAWSGQCLLALVMLRVLAVLVRRAYTAPRELVWLTGVALLVLALGFMFTGEVLPWTREAYSQARVGSQMADYVPLVGDSLRRLLRGGDEVTYITLQRVFAAHVAFFPAALAAVLGLHVYLLHCASEGPSLARRIPVYPDFLVRLTATCVAALAAVMSLATFLPCPIGERADPTASVATSLRPSWYLLPVHELLRAAPPKLLGMDSPAFIGAGGTLVFLLLLCVPFFDRKGSRITVGVTCVAMFVIALLTIHALV